MRTLQKIFAIFCCCLCCCNVYNQENFDRTAENNNALPNNENTAQTQPATTVPYQWISYQLKANITDSEEVTNSVQIFVVNKIDSIIYINLNKIGFELARLVLTPDSLIYVNKLEKNYFRGGYDFLQRRLGIPVRFSMIQALLNAIDFADFQPFTTPALDESGDLRFIAPHRTHNTDSLALMQELTLNAQNAIISNEITDLKSMQTLNIFYKNWQEIGDFPFFTALKIELENEEMTIDAALRNIKFNIVGPTEIRIPEKFTEIKK